MFSSPEPTEAVPIFRIHIPLGSVPIDMEELFNLTKKVFEDELEKPKSSSPQHLNKTLENKIKNHGLIRLEQTSLDIERRERMLKNSILNSNSSSAKESKLSTKGDAYESDDSFIDDTEYDDFVIKADGKDSFSDEMITFEEPNAENEEIAETQSGGDSENSDHETESSKNEETFKPEMEKALEDLSKKATEMKLGNLKKIPDSFEQNLVMIADLRQKLYPRGFPKVLYERIQKILLCPLQTLKNKMKTILDDNSLVDVKKQVKSKHDELQLSVREDILNALKKKTEKPSTTNSIASTSDGMVTILPISDVEKMDHSRLVEYSKTQKVTVLWSKNTKNLFVKAGEILIESFKKEKEFTGKEFDEEKELAKYFKEIQSFWPNKSLDLKKKYKQYTEKETEKKSDGDKKVDGENDKKRKKEEKDEKKEPKKKKKKTENSPVPHPTLATIAQSLNQSPLKSPHFFASQSTPLHNSPTMKPIAPQQYVPINHLNFTFHQQTIPNDSKKKVEKKKEKKNEITDLTNNSQ
jgi:hypothetical protein